MVPKGRERGRMNWETASGMCIALCTKEMTNENLVYGTGNSPQSSVVT